MKHPVRFLGAVFLGFALACVYIAVRDTYRGLG